MEDLTGRLTSLLKSVEAAITKLNIETDRAQAAELAKRTQASDFWADQAQASHISRQLAALNRHIEGWDQLHSQVSEALELAKLGDSSMVVELEASCAKLQAEYGRREFELKMSGPYDKSGAILAIFAGTGGTDAQDWAEMLERMYLRFAEKQGFDTSILDRSAGEEAGIKSVTIEVNGPYAFGRLRSENGVHRLVRLSPFNSDNLRQTSFALVDVLPQLETTPELEIDPKDLRVDVYRAGGHGGQSVNTTDSAVRLTHIPTGIVVAIQNERSQLQNKEKAMAVLRGRLATLMAAEHKERVADIRGKVSAPAWGNQIRSYVLHPYTMVKDHRTSQETSQVQSVLDGDLDQFIEAYLLQQIAA